MSKSPWDFETENKDKSHKSLGARFRNFFQRNSISPGVTENTGPDKKAIKSTRSISDYALAGVVLAFITTSGYNTYSSTQSKHKEYVEQTIMHDFAQQAEAITNLSNRIVKSDPAITVEQQVQDFTKTMQASENHFKNIINGMKLDNSSTAVALLDALKKASSEKEYKDLGATGNLARLKGLLDIGRLETKLLKDYLIRENIILDSKTEDNLDRAEQSYKVLGPKV